MQPIRTFGLIQQSQGLNLGISQVIGLTFDQPPILHHTLARNRLQLNRPQQVPAFLDYFGLFSIQIEFDLGGIQAEKVKLVGPAMAVVFRGSSSLYDAFYKFCAHVLEYGGEVAALQYAGFLSNGILLKKDIF